MKGRDLLLGPNNVAMFNPELAQLIGLNEAIILNQIKYWIEIYKKQEGSDPENSRHYINGRWWVYNTIANWHEQLPYICEKTITRALKKLEDMQLIISGNHNKSSYDKTKWYTINLDALDAMYEKSQSNIDSDKSAKTNCPKEENSCDTKSFSNRTNCPNENETNCPIPSDTMSKPIPKTTSKTSTENTTTPARTENVVVTFQVPSEETVHINQQLRNLNLSEQDINTLWRTSNNDASKLAKALAVLNARRNNTTNVTGFLIAAIKNEYTNTPRVSSSNNACHNFNERTDTDWEALELKLLRQN